jgi:hypothetical protein
LSRGAAITDVQHLLGHASVKTTGRAYAAFVSMPVLKTVMKYLILQADYLFATQPTEPCPVGAIHVNTNEEQLVEMDNQVQ